MEKQKARKEEGWFFLASLLRCKAAFLESAFEYIQRYTLRTLSQESGEKAKRFTLHDRLKVCSFSLIEAFDAIQKNIDSSVPTLA